MRRPSAGRCRGAALRRDHRPYWVKRAFMGFERAWVEHRLRPQLESLGPGYKFMKPWNVRLYGPEIYLRSNVHVITASDRKVCLSVWEHAGHRGRIEVADRCLICPGVRIDSASGVYLGEDSMLASSAYLTDADWHDVYDRTRMIGDTRPLVLERNVWVGDRATLCKGVTIGANSVIGAGAVVTRDVPANVIAAGNPARVVKDLDPDRTLVTRAELFADAQALERSIERLDRYLLADNRLLGWLRALVLPRHGD